MKMASKRRAIKKAEKKKKKAKRAGSLSAGRPAGITKPVPSLSQTAVRNQIRQHHQLEKALDQATEKKDEDQIAFYEQQIRDRGGLAAYQSASLQGQSALRGGDSSRILVEWLRPHVNDLPIMPGQVGPTKPRVLEVGALSSQNEVSTCGLFDVTRIDLRSREPSILQQDFTKRPIPEKDEERFDVISLSLVLNFVAHHAKRGDMLKIMSSFLRSAANKLNEDDVFPSVFVVLPAPCINNSRHLNETHFFTIMKSLGFTMKRRKESLKLLFYLFSYSPSDVPQVKKKFGRKAVNPGKIRNNFMIIIR